MQQGGAGRKVIFATPTRIRPTEQYLAALKDSVPALDAAGWQHQCVFEKGTTYISWARAVLMRRAFLEGGADFCVFLDDDVSWTPEALLRLLATPGDVVAGTYRYKLPIERYMGALIEAPDNRPQVRDDGAVAAHFVPAGFLKLSRRVYDRMNEAHPELRFGSAGSVDAFMHGTYDGLWHGEDYAFSRRWRGLGEALWLVPDLDLTHHCRESGNAYPGNFHRFLLRQPGGSEYQAAGALVSIVIPCHNYARFVGEAIESALAQTHPNVEVIVVDDGSSDNTWEVVKEYADRGVHCLWQTNRGVGAARNAGIATARGEYIVCLDADDRIEPEYVEQCLALNVDVASTALQEFGEAGRCFRTPNVQPTLDDFSKANQVHCASLFRRKVWETVGGWSESRDFECYEDWEFWLRVAKAGFTFGATDAPLFLYRKHGASMIDRSKARHAELAARVRESAGVT